MYSSASASQTLLQLWHGLPLALELALALALVLVPMVVAVKTLLLRFWRR
jgi:hypothetical protein